MGFTGFYWVLLGFTGFYWVLLGFRGLGMSFGLKRQHCHVHDFVLLFTEFFSFAVATSLLFERSTKKSKVDN